MSPIFNYIITIHNQENIIEKVLKGVMSSCSNNGFIYPVLDGCTDGTEAIVDGIIARNPEFRMIKVIANDVHEIKSINLGFNASNQSRDGYNIILQDDVILQDGQLETKVARIYEKVGDKLGYLSFRMAQNLRQTALQSEVVDPFTNQIENAYGAGLSDAKLLLPGRLAFRSIAVKSPVCLPTWIVRKLGPLDERLAPCFHDDTEYSLRLIRNGFCNGVFAICFHSDVRWGGTRKQGSRNPIYQYMARNQKIVIEQYRKEITQMINEGQRLDVIQFDEYCSEVADREAMNVWKESRRQLQHFEMQDLSLLGKIRYVLRCIKRSMFARS
jgi:hypothetical protein